MEELEVTEAEADVQAAGNDKTAWPYAGIHTRAVEALKKAQLASVPFRASDGVMSLGFRTNGEAADAAVEALVAAGLLIDEA